MASSATPVLAGRTASPLAPRSAPAWPGLLIPLGMLAVAVALFASLGPAVAWPEVGPGRFVALAAVLFLAGAMSGMAGFGFGAAGSLSLFLLPPVAAIPMLQGLSIFNQALSIGKLRKDMPRTLGEWFPSGPGPILLGGLAGAPLGVWVLNHVPARPLTILVGSLVLAYSTWSLFKPRTTAVAGPGGWRTAAAIGGLGGIAGGFTANPAMIVSVWTGLRGVTKAASRALVQPYIIVLQMVYIAVNAAQHPDRFGVSYWAMLALTVPVVLPGTLTGLWIYHRLSERDFQRVSFTVLGLGALALILRAL
jgi:uncharacterized membrane protein YfcA